MSRTLMDFDFGGGLRFLGEFLKSTDSSQKKNVYTSQVHNLTDYPWGGTYMVELLRDDEVFFFF